MPPFEVAVVALLALLDALLVLGLVLQVRTTETEPATEPPVASTVRPFSRTGAPAIHQCADPRRCPVCTPPEVPA